MKVSYWHPGTVKYSGDSALKNTKLYPNILHYQKYPIMLKQTQ